MAQEAKRGCGFRRVNGLYLVAGKIWGRCDRMPFPVGHCPVCNEGIKFPRSPWEVQPKILFGIHEKCCEWLPGVDTPNFCPVCNPGDAPGYLLGVGEKFYRTPEKFMEEGMRLGVSKRIPAIPQHLEVGKTWIYLVHNKAIITPLGGAATMGVFAAFRPERIEMPIWESELTPEKAEELQKRGITPVPFKDGDPDHMPKKGRKNGDLE